MREYVINEIHWHLIQHPDLSNSMRISICESPSDKVYEVTVDGSGDRDRDGYWKRHDSDRDCDDHIFLNKTLERHWPHVLIDIQPLLVERFINDRPLTSARGVITRGDMGLPWTLRSIGVRKIPVGAFLSSAMVHLGLAKSYTDAWDAYHGGGIQMVLHPLEGPPTKPDWSLLTEGARVTVWRPLLGLSAEVEMVD